MPGTDAQIAFDIDAMLTRDTPGEFMQDEVLKRIFGVEMGVSSRNCPRPLGYVQ